MDFDLFIINGQVLDGLNENIQLVNIGVIGDEITYIGSDVYSAKKIVDADGHIVSPGFIDIHSHSDYAVLMNPTADSKSRQGVTTEVVGNCGNSAAPMNKALREYRESRMVNEVGEDFKFNWGSVEEYVHHVNNTGVAVNILPLVGHGTIRQNIMGHVNRKPTPMELEQMKLLLSESMKQGAWGLSSGLIYAPGSFSEVSELVELAKVVAEHNGIYTSHVRGEADTVLDAIREAIQVGEESGVKVQYSHAKFSRVANWGKSETALQMIEEARSRGVDFSLDQYPYTAWSTGLSAFLPDWVKDGGSTKLVERLSDPATRKKIIEEGLDYPPFGALMVVSTRHSPDYVGKTITEIAEIEEKTDVDAAFDLILSEDGRVPMVGFCLDESDVRNVLGHQLTLIGSDGRCLTNHGLLGRGKPHPRNYGTFPRVLGHYVREGVLTLPQAVKKMTSMPAERMGLKDRGVLKIGYKADISVFNPDTINDEATFTDPHRFPTGIPYVIVNGVLVVESGELTGALPGKALTKPITSKLS